MKNLIATLMTLLVIAFGATACGEPEPENGLNDSLSQGSDSNELDDVFVDIIRDNTDEFDSNSDEQLLGLADEVCNSWELGADFEEIGSVFLEYQYDAYDAGFFIGAATEAYCSEYSDGVGGSSNT